MSTFAHTARTTVQRHPERASQDHAVIRAILDAHWLCHVAFQDDHGPQVLPTIYWREGEYLYIHGALRSRMIQVLESGAAVCVNVTLIDGLVFARRAFNHSANYRSVNLYGRFEAVTDDAAKAAAFDAFFDTVLPGRLTQVIPPDAKERAATALLRLPITEAVAKTRSGGPTDQEKNDPDSVAHACWTGVLPMSLRAQAPTPSGSTLSDALVRRVTGASVFAEI